MKALTLKSIFLSGILFSIFFPYSNAQIVYTNINPDTTLSCNLPPSGAGIQNCSHTYNIDLNNDGINDFTIASSSTKDVCFSGQIGCLFAQKKYGAVKIFPMNNNAVSSPSNLISNTVISSSTSWNVATNQILRTVVKGPGTLITYTGNWVTATDAYAGLKFSKNGQTYYGWVRLSVTVNSTRASVIVRDYAYDSTPNHSILAGATSGARFTAENISNGNNFSLASYPNPFSNLTTISFYVKLPEYISLKIFDMSGRLITTLADKNFESGEHKIIWDAEEVNAGIYFLQIQSAENYETQKLIVTK